MIHSHSTETTAYKMIHALDATFVFLCQALDASLRDRLVIGLETIDIPNFSSVDSSILDDNVNAFDDSSNDHQNASITLIQSWIRGVQQERRYLISGTAALTLKRWYRGCMGRARYVVDDINMKKKCCIVDSHNSFHLSISFSLNTDGGEFAKLRPVCSSQTPSVCRPADASLAELDVALCVCRSRSMP